MAILCVNPDCKTEMRRLRAGRLCLIEKPNGLLSHVWLCEACSQCLIVEYVAERGVVVRLRQHNSGWEPAALAA